MGCIVDQDGIVEIPAVGDQCSGIVDEDSIPQTQYYQWVTFIFAIQVWGTSFFFYLKKDPHLGCSLLHAL